MITKEHLQHCLEAGDTHLQLADHIKTVRLLDVGNTGAIIETVDVKNRRNIKIAPIDTIEYAYTRNGKQQ
ncbi:hypothetical protein [Corynebacterium glutamicum]|uniref:hypothetical protein n=1 Tax=Corynebacterium glutamicum TaxID=1718 RepID=UPI000303C1C7|nr:hypothetical protein [Corynebacterium glutamicum]